MKVSQFYCQDFFGWSDESYWLHALLFPTLVSAKPVHAMTRDRHFFLHSNCKGVEVVTGNELPVVIRL